MSKATAVGLGIAALFFYAKRNKKSSPVLEEAVPFILMKKKSYWRVIIELLAAETDPHAQKLVAAMIFCAGVFAKIDASKAKTGGELFRAVYLGDTRNFRRLLIKNVTLCLGLAVANKFLANLVSSLARHWQGRLISKIHEKYFRGSNYYRVQQKVDFPHERICTDTQQLTRDLALLTCDAINSTINFCFFGSKVFFLVKEIAGPVCATQVSLGPLIYALSAWSVISLVTPNFAAVRKQQRNLETEYRQAFMRFGRSTEAVALYGGEEYERGVLTRHFKKLVEFVEKARIDKFGAEVLSQYMQKYCTHSVMLGLVMLPFFTDRGREKFSKKSDNSGLLFKVRYLADLIYMEMISLGSMARLLSTIRQVAGSVERVGVLVEALVDLDEGSSVETRQSDHRPSLVWSSTLQSTDQPIISFEDVSIETPSGHPLVQHLTFSVKQGISIIICGPNGAGKSSIFRCLGGLWPIKSGKITRPGGDKVGLHSSVFYLPQKPYSVFGTLAENVTYPDSSAPDDKQLLAVLRLVELEHLYVQGVRDGSIRQPQNWERRLSMGEQQRLAMARLFWQRPVFAVLDECTSAVSLKMERRLFRVCRQLGISLVTISHRPALVEFHDWMLALDGAGAYSMQKVQKTGSMNLGNSPIAQNMSLADLSGSPVPIDRLVARLERSGSIAHFDFENRKPDKSVGSGEVATSVTPATIESLLHSKPEIGFSTKLIKRLISLSSAKHHCAALVVVVVMKTYLSNKLAHLNGESVKLLLAGDRKEFAKLVALALSLGFAQAVLLPGLDALEESLAMVWRRWLTEQLIEKLFMARNYFRKSTSADQIVVEDAEKLASKVANLWTEAAKPLVDFIWFNSGVVRLTGFRGLTWLGLYAAGGSAVLRALRPDIAGLTAEKERLDGEFASAHARVAANSESIAFLDGGAIERKIVEQRLDAKLSHQQKQKRAEHLFGVPDQFVSVFLPQQVSWVLSMLYRLDLKDVVTGELGFPINLTHDLRYLGTVVSNSFGALGTLVELSTKWETTRGHIERVRSILEEETPVLALAPGGEVQFDAPAGEWGEHICSSPDQIEFQNVDVVTPGREQILVSRLSFCLREGSGLMIAGPTGSGKSAILRTIQGLWFPGSGVVDSDPRSIHYVPTRPYSCQGSIADQVTYPEKALVTESAAISESLKIVRLGYLAERESLFGKESINWDLQLSLGEQQRIAIARLLFAARNKCITFGLLDECTSAVALDGEEEIYRALQAQGIKTVTATSKPWLENFHSFTIQLGEGGSYEVGGKGESVVQTRLPDFVYMDKRQPGNLEIVNATDQAEVSASGESSVPTLEEMEPAVITEEASRIFAEACQGDLSFPTDPEPCPTASIQSSLSPEVFASPCSEFVSPQATRVKEKQQEFEEPGSVTPLSGDSPIPSRKARKKNKKR